MYEALLAMLFALGAEASDKLETAFLAANIYHESRGEISEGQLCVAYVTIARASDNNPVFGGPTLRSVVFKENMREDSRWTAEFSWWERPRKPREYKHVVAAWQLARRARLQPLNSLCHLKQVRYYKNSQVAGSGGSCWFERNTVYVGSVGNHDFYRPHRTVYEWKQGMRKRCYRPTKSMTVAARVPRPRPSPTVSAEEVVASIP